MGQRCRWGSPRPGCPGAELVVIRIRASGGGNQKRPGYMARPPRKPRKRQSSIKPDQEKPIGCPPSVGCPSGHPVPPGRQQESDAWVAPAYARRLRVSGEAHDTPDDRGARTAPGGSPPGPPHLSRFLRSRLPPNGPLSGHPSGANHHAPAKTPHTGKKRHSPLPRLRRGPAQQV